MKFSGKCQQMIFQYSVSANISICDVDVSLLPTFLIKCLHTNLLYLYLLCILINSIFVYEPNGSIHVRGNQLYFESVKKPEKQSTQ
jgi:hypothetical protein